MMGPTAMEPCVPGIIEYDKVLEQMSAQQFRCNYYHSGAFGFPETAKAGTLAWIGPPDSTIRPASLPLTRQVTEPYEKNLAQLAGRAWRENLPGPIWVMPMSHWAFELSHGSQEWLPAVMERIGVDAALLDGRNDAAAIEFSAGEQEGFDHLAESLLRMLRGSDFMLAFPDRPVLCTLHHHKQLWWSTTDVALLATLELLVAK
jgi:hypothetical protein